jgi:hypothetical protein
MASEFGKPRRDMPENPPAGFWEELRRRKVIRVAVVYAVIAWAAVEAASVLFPSLLLPEWSLRLLVVMALIGFPVAVGLAWAFEVRPERSPEAAPVPAPASPVKGGPPEDEPRLEGWKRIALHLNRDVRTVRRWEKNQGLPVRRLMHDKQATVYAYQSELDAWVADRDAAPAGRGAPRTTDSPSRKPWPWLAAAAVLVAAIGAWYALSDRQGTAIALGEWDWVMITDFDNRTGEDVLEGTVEYALQGELANSRQVKVAPRGRVAADEGTAGRAHRPGDGARGQPA